MSATMGKLARTGSTAGGTTGAAGGTTAGQRLARQRWLVLGLGATLVAAYFAPPADDGGVVPSAPTQRVQAASAASAAAPGPGPDAARARTVLAILPREAFDGDDGLFRGQAVAMAAPQARPQPPAVLASAPAEEPVPRLNLKLIGRYVDNGATAAFVQLQDQNLVVRVGEVLGAQHRVDQIDEVSLTLRHLPSGQLQTYRLDGAP